jgi:hypothetical protein
MLALISENTTLFRMWTGRRNMCTHFLGSCGNTDKALALYFKLCHSLAEASQEARKSVASLPSLKTAARGVGSCPAIPRAGSLSMASLHKARFQPSFGSKSDGCKAKAESAPCKKEGWKHVRQHSLVARRRQRNNSTRYSTGSSKVRRNSLASSDCEQLHDGTLEPGKHQAYCPTPWNGGSECRLPLMNR